MKHKLLWALLLTVIPSVCFSQSEVTDSVAVAPLNPDSIIIEVAGQHGNTAIDMPALRSYNQEINPLLRYRLSRPLDLSIPDLHFVPGQARLFGWNRGAIIASGSTISYTGLMQIDSGEFGVYQSAGDFSFHVGGMVNKYDYFNGLHTQYGLNGSISYQFTLRLSATLFGEYYFGQPPRMANGMPMPPAMIGYYGRSAFGGYLDYQINEHWGVQTGVQAVQQVGTRRYEMEPIVTPYYKISKKVSIGLPVGQILYHIVREHSNRHRH